MQTESSYQTADDPRPHRAPERGHATQSGVPVRSPVPVAVLRALVLTLLCDCVHNAVRHCSPLPGSLRPPRDPLWPLLTSRLGLRSQPRSSCSQPHPRPVRAPRINHAMQCPLARGVAPCARGEQKGEVRGPEGVQPHAAWQHAHTKHNMCMYMYMFMFICHMQTRLQSQT